VDDHAVVRSGLRMLLEGQHDVEIVGEAATAAEALEKTAQLNPDMILMDIGLPDKSGKQTFPAVGSDHVRDVVSDRAGF